MHLFSKSIVRQRIFSFLELKKSSDFNGIKIYLLKTLSKLF